MDKNLLEIRNLSVSVENRSIINHLNLSISHGEIHVLMGPNGAGKSTLVSVLAGHPSYRVTQGGLEFQGKSLLSLSPDARMHQGLFTSFQSSPEIAGISYLDFLEQAVNAKRRSCQEKPLTREAFLQLVSNVREQTQIPSELLQRSLHVGFSGGEKKRSELFQLALFQPLFAVLDEIDSGLDIDALQSVGKTIHQLQNNKRSLLLITHNPKLLSLIPCHRVHVLLKGSIVASGDRTLASQIEKRGYEWL